MAPPSRRTGILVCRCHQLPGHVRLTNRLRLGVRRKLHGGPDSSSSGLRRLVPLGESSRSGPCPHLGESRAGVDVKRGTLLSGETAIHSVERQLTEQVRIQCEPQYLCSGLRPHQKRGVVLEADTPQPLADVSGDSDLGHDALVYDAPHLNDSSAPTVATRLPSGDTARSHRIPA